MWAIQVDALRDGLNRLVRVEHLQLFSEAEVALLLAGTSDISVKDWREHTIYGGGYHRSSVQVVWFWQVHRPHLSLRVAWYEAKSMDRPRAPSVGSGSKYEDDPCLWSGC
jgi:hypothetical protein